VIPLASLTLGRFWENAIRAVPPKDGLNVLALINRPVLIVPANKGRVAARLWQFNVRSEDLEQSGQTNARSYQVIREFYAIGKDAVPALILALQDEDVQVRRNAALILALFAAPSGPFQGVIDIREALPSLRERLQDPDADVRQMARRVIRSAEELR
jgi:hypothetical protein